MLSINHAEQMEALSGFHVWTDEFVNKRIAWKPLHAADLIVLRTLQTDRSGPDTYRTASQRLQVLGRYRPSNRRNSVFSSHSG